jgi:anaerobic magnesium-protoporphyrin IX monomethyl ester cyclase
VANVTLIRLPSVVGRFALTLNVTPPLSLAYLAGSLTAAGHHVSCIDAVGEAIEAMHPSFRPGLLQNGLTVEQIVARIGKDTTLVGISCLFSHEWPLVRKLTREIRTAVPDATLVLGGEHATAAPDFSLREAPELDACVLGEGEETCVELARAVDEGRPLSSVAGLAYRLGGVTFRSAARARIRAIDDIPLPRWDLLPIDRYLDGGFSFGVDRGRTMPMLATRGCPYRCTFCSSPRMWTTRYVTRDPRRVVDEIEGYVRRWGVSNIDFYDLTAIIRKDWIVSFCQELLRRDLSITWQLPSGTRSEAIDREVSGLLYRSGCRNVSYAPESGSPKTLSRIKKKVSLPRLLSSIEGAVDNGLNVKANVLIGFPGETHADILESLRFVGQLAWIGAHDVSVWTFSPYPGSELFERLTREGRIPAMDDDYFAALLSYSDLAGAVSFDEHVSSDALRRYRLLGLLLFYGASYARRPERLFTLARNVLHERYESRLEMSLANLVRRLSRARPWRMKEVPAE